jgi:purine-binding chemotaxis protein CheW
MTAMMTNDLAVLTFRLGNQQYALPIDDVVEVAVMVELTRLSGVRPEILGMINRHGVPLLLLDLRAVFGQENPLVDASTLFIVTTDSKEAKLVGLVVDEIQQVEYLPSHAPTTTNTAQYIRSVVSHRSRLMQIIAVDSLLASYLIEV